MSPAEAAKLLEVPADATPEQLEARFLELRTRLEDKIAKAPTPGLKAKYRESLDQITVAFETLTLAADGSALPVLQKQSAVISQPSAGGPASLRAATPAPGAPAPKKSGGKEFVFVALIAVAVLGAGGWWVMKTRAEKAEAARIAAEAKAEQERKAEEARLAAEAKRQADEQEKARVDKLSAQLRGELAEHKVEWEAIEREEHVAERRLAELKSDTRNLKDAPAGKVAEMQAQLQAQQDYHAWLSETLARHPARIARSRAEELLSARDADLAQPAVAELKSALARLGEEIAQERKARLAIEGRLSIRTSPGVAWTLTDAFERTRTGQGPAEVDRVAFGPARIEFTKPFWPARTEKALISRGQANEVVTEMTGYNLSLVSVPAGAEVLDAEGKVLGVTPLQLTDLPRGEWNFTLRKHRHHDEPVSVTLPQSGPGALAPVTLRTLPPALERPKGLNPPAQVAMARRYQSESHRTGTETWNYDSKYAEQWDFSDPDLEGRWQKVTRHVARPADPSVIEAVLRHERLPNNKWMGTLLKTAAGSEGTYEHHKDYFPGSFIEPFYSPELWPAKETPVGGTWPVSPPLLPNIDDENSTAGTAQGKLVALDVEAGRAEIEYSYSWDFETPTHRYSCAGIYRLKIDLREKFITSYECRGRVNSRLEQTPGDVFTRQNQFTDTITFTKR